MDTILQQKKKGEKNFRLKIDDYLSKSQFTKQEDQLTPDVLNQIFSLPNFEGMYSNSKINIEKLCQHITKSEGHCNTKQLTKILGNKKQIKTSDLYQILKNHDLHEFDLQEEIINHFFEGNSFSLKKLDLVMKDLGYGCLNAKDKEILIDCFDIDRNKIITGNDLQQMMNRCVQLRNTANMKANKQKIRDSTLSRTKIDRNA